MVMSTSHQESEKKLYLRTLLNITTPADKLLFTLLILVSMSGYLFGDQFFPKTSSVVIEVDGRQVYLLPATENRTVPVKGVHGYTYVEIRDGRVRITGSPCSNKLCVKHGWISSGALVCLPNRVVVTIGSQTGKNTSTDAITG
jgi:hypothetical protein